MSRYQTICIFQCFWYFIWILVFFLLFFYDGEIFAEFNGAHVIFLRLCILFTFCDFLDIVGYFDFWRLLSGVLNI